MILDIEQSPKSPTFPVIDSQQTAAPSTGSFRHTPSRSSYSTFAASHSYPHTQYRIGQPSDLTTLLDRNDPQSLSDDEQPPAYDEISRPQKSRNHYWTRGAGLFLIVLLAYSAWASIRFSKAIKSDPRSDVPLPTSPIPTLSPSPPSPTTPASSSPLPTLSPLPPLPPYDPTPSTPDPPYVLPESGRTDLCRPWALSLDNTAYPAQSDNKPTDRIVYTVPSLAPIHMEAITLCPTSNGTTRGCDDYDNKGDAVVGTLQVVGADIELPRVEMFLQHGSELGLEDVAVCLMRHPLVEGKDDENHKWVLGIYIWKDPKETSRNKLLASVSIVVSMPFSHVHDFSTNLDHFTQTIGSSVGMLSFGTLNLTGAHGDTDVLNINAAVIETVSSNNQIKVNGSSISRSLSLRSYYGLVWCNVTLVSTGDEYPVKAHLQSEASVAQGLIDLEYPHHSTANPHFETTAFSRYSPSIILMTDHQGDKSLHTNPFHSILPNIRLTVSSEYSVAQAALPPTYHGTFDLHSSHASTVVDDRAAHLLGRRIDWSEHTREKAQGEVQWVGRHLRSGGNVHMSTEFAIVKISFLGLDDDPLG